MSFHKDQSFKKDRKPKTIVILGATSAIAEAAARLWAEDKAHLVLLGRDSCKLEAIAADLRARGAEAETLALDLAQHETAAQTLGEISGRAGGLDVVLLAYGVLSDQKRAETDWQEAEKTLAINFTSAAAWCHEAATLLERQGHGKLLVIGSVAGDRGRASNYVYGAAKAGLGVLVQGIAHRLAKSGARAVLIKPGFVDTPMTAHITPKGPLWAKPAAIGKIIVKLAHTPSPPPIVYAPGFWRGIMSVVRAVPSAIFHKTKF